MSIQLNQASKILTVEKIREVLKHWGEWMRLNTSADYRLGYPTSAAFAHIGETTVRAVSCPPTNEVARMDDAMRALGKWNGAYCMALIHKHEKQQTIKDAANQMNVSVKTYKNWCLSGESFIAGNYF